MREDVKRLYQILLEGKCCASAIVQLGLELKGEKNEQLVQAVSGLCFGIHGGSVCGALTGAACLLNIFDPGKANREMVPELVEWFKDAYGEKYGGINCSDIVGDAPVNRTVRCPSLIETAYLQTKTILEGYGHDFD